MAGTWARRARTPQLKRLSRRKAFQSAVALSLRGKIYKRHFRRTINGECVVAALEHVRRQVGGGFILVWDRSRPHRSRVVTAYLAAHPEIKVEWLPPYAPELNPEEYCHGNVKERMRNSAPERRADAATGRARLQPLTSSPRLAAQLHSARGAEC